MTETQAYLELLFMLGVVVLLPFFWRVCYLVGQLFITYLFPPKTITIEVKRANGQIVKQKINIADNEALVDALLHSTGKVVR